MSASEKKRCSRAIQSAVAAGLDFRCAAPSAVLSKEAVDIAEAVRINPKDGDFFYFCDSGFIVHVAALQSEIEHHGIQSVMINIYHYSGDYISTMIKGYESFGLFSAAVSSTLGTNSLYKLEYTPNHLNQPNSLPKTHLSALARTIC